MKSILISIKPEYVEKILNHSKTIEIRKTMPKCELPCKVYIYCTKAKPTLQYFYNWENYKPISEHSTWADGRTINLGGYGNGKVVAEFTLKNISYWQPYWTPEVMHICDISEKSCVSIEGLMKYCGDEIIYALHIEDLKIYDKPKELSEFSSISKRMKGKESRFTSHLLQRPPQSWMFVKSLEGK